MTTATYRLRLKDGREVVIHDVTAVDYYDGVLFYVDSDYKTTCYNASEVEAAEKIVETKETVN